MQTQIVPQRQDLGTLTVAGQTANERGRRMDETEEHHRYWESELARLQELRDDTVKVLIDLDYTTRRLYKK